jgi:hypothetical protein
MLDRLALRLAVLTAILAVGACAQVGGDSEPSDRPADAGVAPRPSTPYDGGAASWRDASAPASTGSTSAGNNSSSSSPISFTVNDAAVGLDDLLNAAGSLFGGSPADSGAGSGSSSPAGDGGAAGQCVNAPCTTTADCQRLYPASCGFTTCQASVCR